MDRALSLCDNNETVVNPKIATARLLRQVRGQVSIVIAMMILTFMLFFAFVVNTGMLVNAKINLQNAADVAAYAGAAVQARQLNQISFLNYELRRNYKKFLFRYYILGNLAQKGFPMSPGTGNREWKPAGKFVDYKTPAVCITYKKEDNFCQMDELIKINIPNSGFDSTSQALRSILSQIEKIRLDNCDTIGRTNLNILFFWLYSTVPDAQALEKPDNQADAKMFTTIQEITRGLGLVPKSQLLKKRIDALASYVNQSPATALTKERADEMVESKDTAARERMLQAFYSAYHTLGEHTFPESTIRMDELLPEGDSQADLLRLNAITPDFSAYAVNFESMGDNSDCKPKLVEIPVAKGSFIAGVFKDPTQQVHYAVRVSAQAKLLFSPFGDLNLSAYSAARPFGSRIGPDLPEGAFTAGGKQPNGTYISADSKSGKIPSLPLNASETWESNNVLGAIYQVMKPPESGVQTAFTGEDIQKAMQAAMAPNPYEEGKYNIPADFLGDEADPYVTHFNDATGQFHGFWAPLKAKEQLTGDLKKEIEDSLIQVRLPQTLQSRREDLKRGLGIYVGTLQSGGTGDNDEGFNVVRISNPLRYSSETGPSSGQTISLQGNDLLMKDPERLQSSWKKRIGYGVKFVSFKSLRESSRLSDDKELEEDIKFLNH